MMTIENKRASVKVLEECIELQNSKSRDYQNPASTVKQADHYLRGIDTIYDMLHQKMLRARSLIETARVAPGVGPNHEPLEDTFKDIINYASFAVSYLRKQMDGQLPARDMFNRPTPMLNTIDNGMGSYVIGVGIQNIDPGVAGDQ